MALRPTFEPVFDIRAILGEGAFWSARHAALYWVDIPAGLVHRSDPSDGRTQSWDLGHPVGCVTETTDGRVVAARSDGFACLDPATGKVTPLGGPQPGTHGHRFNDGTTDPAGRFVAGTMGLTPRVVAQGAGRLYAFDGVTAHEIMGGFHTVNGLAFSPDGRTM